MPDEALRSTIEFKMLLALLEQMLRESGSREAQRDFDAAPWLEAWLASPAPALGGQPPLALVRSEDGLDCVRRLLLSQQTGAHW